jgi:hypothetical protein
MTAAYRLALGRGAFEDERDAMGKYADEFGMEKACRVILNLCLWIEEKVQWPAR